MAVTDGHTTQKGVFPMMNEAEKNVYRLLRSWRRLHVEKELFESRYDLSHAQRMNAWSSSAGCWRCWKHGCGY